MHYATTHDILPILTGHTAPFDTHTIEREFRSHHPELFDSEVGHYATSTDQLHIFSMQFGRWLLDMFPHVIRPTRKIVTNNLRERPSSNQEWVLIRQ
jgi:hypothetical protein